MRTFVADYGLPFPSAIDADGSLWARFGVRAQPAFVFVSADGAAELVFGALPEDELAARLDTLASSS